MVGWVAGEIENKAIFQLEVEVEVGAWQFIVMLNINHEIGFAKFNFKEILHLPQLSYFHLTSLHWGVVNVVFNN